ncbi:apolipoprotein N-acyltransferase [Rhodococcus olei]|uniref:Apolipoprotein N-acyltransferase n=1 Tax=Rhodococcus olei TaxID=2161675 RepID=A0ABP8P5I3_9NOCA
MSRWPARGAALLAGALPAVAFPDANAAILAWIALVPALLVLRASGSAREAVLRGWLLGLGFLVATQSWPAPNLVYFYPLAVAVLALLWAGWGALAWFLVRGELTGTRTVAAVVGVPAAWVLIEVVRSWQWLGGPWSLMGATQWRHPTVLALAGLGGVWLVGYAVVAVNTALAVTVVGPARARVVAGAAAVIVAAAGPVWFALGPAPTPAGALRVALIQPGIGPGDTMIREQQLTREIPGDVGLVVWGESSVDADLGDRPDVAAQLTALSRDVGADLLVNVDARSGDTGAISKTATLIDESGVVATYRKTRLVPFGEYVPFRDRLGWLSRITAAAAQNRVPGHRLVVMSAAGTPFGPLISFELTFPDLARRLTNDGAALLVYQTSTSTFQDSSGPAQLTSVGAVRAAETGRPVAVAALSGVSAAFDARGRRFAWLPTTQSGSLVVDLTPTSGSTLYARVGDWVPVACAALVVGLGLTAARPRPRRSRTPDRPPEPDEP